MAAHHVIVFLADTAFIASRGGWLYCDDSRVTPANAKDVVVSGIPVLSRFHSLLLLVLICSIISAGQASIRPVLQTC
jgi:hypothetical protein